MTEKYRRVSNFRFSSPVTSVRYKGTLDTKFLDVTIGEIKNNAEQLFISYKMNEKTKHQLKLYDKEIHEQNNDGFLCVWLDNSKSCITDTKAPIYTVYVKSKANTILGYGSVMISRVGRRIGPLFADNFEICLLLLKELNNYKFLDSNDKHRELYLNLPSIKTNMINFLLKSDFEVCSVHDRSFTRNAVDLCYDRIYAFSGQFGAAE